MMPDRGMRLIEIVLIEDNPADIRLTKESLKEAKVACNLHTFMDGGTALDFLFRSKYADAPRPDLVLLDLNLPGVDGRTILKEIKGDPVLRVIPVVILTSSEAESDIVKAYESHANCFVSKPIDFDGFVKVVMGIENFWFTLVKLPQADVATSQG